jgi:hypothetical protein
VENKNIRNGSANASRRYRYANLTIRVPVDQLDAFVEHVSGASNVVHYSENAKDITLSYVATQRRITALETEQTRLLELLAQAENMSDLLQIEQLLTDVGTELFHEFPTCTLLDVIALQARYEVLVKRRREGLNRFEFFANGVDVALLQHIRMEGCLISVLFKDVPCCKFKALHGRNGHDVLDFLILLRFTATDADFCHFDDRPTRNGEAFAVHQRTCNKCGRYCAEPYAHYGEFTSSFFHILRL